MTEFCKITVPRVVTTDMIWNAIIGAFEGGSTDWIHSAEFLESSAPLPPADDPDRRSVWYGKKAFYEHPFRFIITSYDTPEDDEGDGTGKMIVDNAAVIAGLEKMAAGSPQHFNDLLDENDDAITHDTLMQYIVLGEVIYG